MCGLGSFVCFAHLLIIRLESPQTQEEGGGLYIHREEKVDGKAAVAQGSKAESKSMVEEEGTTHPINYFFNIRE